MPSRGHRTPSCGHCNASRSLCTPANGLRNASRGHRTSANGLCKSADGLRTSDNGHRTSNNGFRTIYFNLNLGGKKLRKMLKLLSNCLYLGILTYKFIYYEKRSISFVPFFRW